MPTKNDDAKEIGSQENIKVADRICPYPDHGCVSQNGRHCFHNRCQPVDDQGRRFLIITDVQDGQTFTHTRYLPERVMARIIDVVQCNGCPALKICSAIVPNGPWNPAPGNGVKACPGVLG
ncbi:MAG: hypothetical protein WC455_20185 [Dehalococcoidia bacterium]|jgi:hypothetical protein